MSAAPATVAAVTAPDALPVPGLDQVRDSYDRVAARYVDLAVGSLEDRPWLRAALTAFAEEVRPLGPVLDVGCGPGTTTAYLAERGVQVRAVDLSPRMVEHARRANPGVDVQVASATELRPAPASLGGVLAWWSLFHLPRPVLERVVGTLAGALVPGGLLVLGTHAGVGDLVRTEAYGGVPVAWTTHLWRPEDLTAVLERAGLTPGVELRFPPAGLAHPQVIVTGRRGPTPPSGGA